MFLRNITTDAVRFINDIEYLDVVFKEALSGYYNDEDIFSALIGDEIYPIGIVDDCIFLSTVLLECHT